MLRAAIASVLLLGISPVRADDVEAILAQYVIWRGGTAFEALQSIHERGDVAQGGLRGKFEQWQVNDGRLRRNETLGPLSSALAASESAGWQTNTSGQIEDLGGDAERARRVVVLSFDRAGANQGEHYSLLGTEQLEGKSWNVVRVQFSGPDTYDLLIAPGSGVLLGERITEDRKTRFVRYADWRLINGVRMPFAEEQTGSNAADRKVQHAAEIQINVQATQALFSRPPEKKIWSFAAGQTSTGWIDFELIRDKIFIPARINGHPVNLLLDSGADITVIDSRFAKTMVIKSSGTLPVRGGGGQATLQLASNFQIELGNLKLQRMTAGVIDLAEVATAIGKPLPLILGKEAINPLVIDIDFQRHRIAFHDPDQFSSPDGAVRVPLGRHGGKRTVAVSVEGRPAVPFDFDLGAEEPLQVYSSYRDGEHVLDGRPESLTLSGGVGGIIKVKVATLKSIAVAGIPMTAVPSEFPDAADNAMNSDQTAGNLGLPIFSRFRLITDYPHNALWLIPDTSALAQPFGKNRSGLLGFPAVDRMKVLFVAPGSPAEKAGWKEGSEIVAVDGHRIDADFAASVQSHWSQQPAGTVVTLTLADGTTQQLILADYY
jgi:hypothetical protein